MKECENCGSPHDGTIGSGRFCSIKCSRGFATKEKRKEINEKVSLKLKGSGNKPIQKVCLECGKEFKRAWAYRNQKYCSNDCSMRGIFKNPDIRKKISDASRKSAIERHQDPNKTFGWKTRKKFQPSYPESIAKRVLDENNIEYEFNYPFFGFFIDFAILKNKIAIEIDGKQHELPDRIETDKRKDLKLLEEGWKLYRIKFPKDNIIENINNILASIPSA